MALALAVTLLSWPAQALAESPFTPEARIGLAEQAGEVASMCAPIAIFVPDDDVLVTDGIVPAAVDVIDDEDVDADPATVESASLRVANVVLVDPPAATQLRREVARHASQFNAAAASMSASISSLRWILIKASALGVDTSSARRTLSRAQVAYSQARVLERDAMDLFRVVPNADNPRQVFGNARSLASQATAKLSLARSRVLQAIRELRAAMDRRVATT